MNVLTDNLFKVSVFNEILDSIKQKNASICFKNVMDIQKALYIYNLTKSSKNCSVVVCSNVLTANKMIQDLKFFSDIDIIYFPAKQIIYYDVEAQSKEIQNARMYALSKLNENNKKIIVTTIDSLMLPMIPQRTNIDETILIKKDEEINFTKLAQKLVEYGYEKTDNVEGKGQFALRGGIIDVFAVESDAPYRIEFFGDCVDSIRCFDVLSQRSISSMNEASISCVSEFVVTGDKLKEINEKLSNIIEGKISNELKLNIQKDIEFLENGILDNLTDKYFNLLVDNPTFFTDYIKGYNIFIDEPVSCKKKADSLYYENLETLKILSKREYMDISFANKYITFEEVEEKIKEFTNIYMEKQVFDNSISKKRQVFDFKSKEMFFYRNSFETLLNDIKALKNKNILLVFPSMSRVEQVKNYLIDNNIKVEVLDNIWQDKKLVKDRVYITFGILSGGFYSSTHDLVVIAEPVSGTNLKRKVKKDNTNKLDINSFEELKIGDYVVHENHGIGIYRGIQSISVQDVIKDYIKIEYLNNGALYVPINQLDLVKKYICDDESIPKINSLSNKEWEKTKKKVSAHVEEMAKELLSLYAKRENNPGYSFNKDTPWQKEFEDAFEYELTDDQKQAVMEIKADMESNKVMDRLLCGDVGYGKTEVALRVAFKAVMDKKQVAYLVPTTVLCLQQYRTFKERMEKFGVNVEMLSRFKTTSQQKKILKDLIDGKIDVLIGTHRMLSSDVFFNNLGLLIIDEEHRFGVKAKESIKKIKETVDVLSMTATPIPRTLHMSMVGIRGMSTLTEPPLERLPVHTYVMEYNDDVIKEAIEKELLRDGQVFYLNNRVEGIEELTEKVKKLVPNARVAYAHGRMDPHEIEDIMIKFINHEFDIIVCTSILESGIDIPNANTLIVENADMLGLAQLYQIRGRVGRSSRLAYAYITYKKNKQISEVAEKRLKAIRDFTEFGSGFKIALRDLEIRGAGSLLGKEQHGHMLKVGYDMYLSLLQRAIKKEKEDIESLNDIEQEIKIDIDVSAYISDDYIKDPIQKISMYQKISDIKDKDTMLDVIDELIDRYGSLPRETENLIKIVEIRNLARELNIKRICLFGEILKIEPYNLQIYLTNSASSDILIRIQIELEKLKKEKEKKYE